MKKNRYNYGTYGFWFNKLPMSARMKARRNFSKDMSNNRLIGLNLTSYPLSYEISGVLSSSFLWNETPEGHEYWKNIAYVDR